MAETSVERGMVSLRLGTSGLQAIEQLAVQATVETGRLVSKSTIHRALLAHGLRNPATRAAIIDELKEDQ